ncbi:MAG: YqaJ viral recombinase family protein [Prevotella sp.]|nr:YqaJ viral recombinase family protein [Prevotella sp.]
MSYTIIRQKNREEWLKDRSGGIGSSEVATVLGLNPWETPLQLWRRKKGIDPPKAENFAMKAGHYLEDAVSKFYADETGKDIIKASAGDWLIVNKEKPFLRVSPDRTYWIPGRPKSDRNKGIVECKTTQMEVDYDNPPQHWFCQLQYQLGVAELEQGALAWLTMGRDFGYRDFTFDKEFYDWMVEEVEKFWTDNIVGNVEPDPVNVEDVLLRNPRHLPGKLVEADADIIEACKQLKEIKEELSDLDSRKKELEDKIKMSMGDAEALTAPGGTPAKPLIIATWKAAKDSQKFDEKSFAASEPNMYQSYLKTVPGSRRFLLK